MSTPRFRIAGTVLSTRDAQALAAFYERLLGWPRRADEPGWVILRPDAAGHGLSFHEDVEFLPPTWPSRSDQQQMMVHLDIATDDLDAAVAHAVECGARLAGHQPQDGVRVMLDPDGHPFCLFVGPATD
jgi:catechol 2,3-dioxygenase-like lactoylglutathione lyase family enzyme